MTSGSIRDEEQAELLLLSGGGGGARLAAGLHVATAGERFSVVTNTSPTSPKGTGSPVPGVTISTTTPSSRINPSIDSLS